MKRVDYWSKSTNLKTGAKFEAMLSYFRVAHNGKADIDRFIDSEYGEEVARRLDIGFRYEEDSLGEACMDYYSSLGLKKEMHDN